MYHILEINTGQPMILWQFGNNLQKYTIQSGRIYNRGIIKKDINRDFQVWNTTPPFISYSSVDASNVICQVDNESMNEVFSTKDLCSFITINNHLYILSLTSEDSTYSLYLSKSDDFTEKTLLCDKLEATESINVAKTDNYIVVFLSQKQLFFTTDFKLINTLSLSSSKNANVSNLQNEVSKLKFELHQLEQHHSDFVKEYDQLFAYTGELQEKLRKTKLNVQ
jgi:hypothetical protein